VQGLLKIIGVVMAGCVVDAVIPSWVARLCSELRRNASLVLGDLKVSYKHGEFVAN